MIRTLFRLLAGRSSRPAGAPSCGCHPWFHDLGVHRPNLQRTKEQA